jgi:lactam utilization protein B
VHGDGPNAARIAASVRAGLAAEGVALTGLADALG